MGLSLKNANHSPQTKGKVESKNRFINWLKPYNYEFENEDELIDIIKKIQEKANEKANGTTLIAPNLLYEKEKEKEYLQQLPNERLFDQYCDLETPAKVSKESLITFRKSKYSVPMKYINKTVNVKVIDDTLYVYYSKELIQVHTLSNNGLRQVTLGF